MRKSNQKQRLVNIGVQINTPTEKISPIKSEMLLGIFIQDDLKWNEYIQNNEKSLLNQLNTRLNVLKMISITASQCHQDLQDNADHLPRVPVQ